MITVVMLVSGPHASEAAVQLFEFGVESVVHSALVLHIVAKTTAGSTARVRDVFPDNSTEG